MVLSDFRICVAVSLLLVAGVVVPASGEGEPVPQNPFGAAPTEEQRRSLALCEALAEAGIPVTRVEITEGSCRVDLKAETTPAQRAKAAEIEQRVMSAPLPTPVVVANWQDALVVVQFDPGNSSAREVLRRRYLELQSGKPEER